jgi:hypothetical protein
MIRQTPYWRKRVHRPAFWGVESQRTNSHLSVKHLLLITASVQTPAFQDSSEMLVPVHRSTQDQTPEGHNFKQVCCVSSFAVTLTNGPRHVVSVLRVTTDARFRIVFLQWNNEIQLSLPYASDTFTSKFCVHACKHICKIMPLLYSVPWHDFHSRNYTVIRFTVHTRPEHTGSVLQTAVIP